MPKATHGKFRVYGEGRYVLHEADTHHEAMRWLSIYTRQNDFGGWEYIIIRDPRHRIVHADEPAIHAA